MIYLGLDLGSKTLGLAISDRTSTIATSLDVIRFNNYDELFNSLDSVVYLRKIDAFVLGNPLNLNGSVSDRSKICFEFKELLESRYPTKEVIMQDERLSTVEATNYLLQSDMSRKKRKHKVDSVAANIILQTYLDKTKGR